MDYDEAKADVLALHPAQIMAGRVEKLADRERAAAGMVQWDANPPSGIPQCYHRLSFL